MNREVLEAPFPASIVKNRKGAHGEVFYVEAPHYIRRLNEAFDGIWSWKLLSHQIDGTEVVVHGALEAGGLVRHAFGGANVTINKSTGEVVSLGDDLKAAATDALKKACSLLGIGLDLYAPVAEAPQSSVSTPQSFRSPQPQRHTSMTSTERGDVAPIDRNRLTAKQLRAIYAIGHSQGLSDPELKHRSRESFGVLPEFLSRKDASAFIEALNAA